MDFQLLTDDEIRTICKQPGVERVIITGSGNHKDIGIKFGLFSQATDLTSKQSPEMQRGKIRKLLVDLRMMNVNNNRQIKEAASARERFNANNQG